jgi:hypothetical protein
MHKPFPKFMVVQKLESQNLSDDLQCSFNSFWDVLGDRPSHQIVMNESILMVYGDWINATDDYTVISDISEFISVVKGHCVFLFIKKETVQIATSYFSFLPVYYTTDGKFVSNNWEESAKKSDCQLDEMFVIESHLFNYPLGNATLYRDVKLLDSFNVLTLDELDVTSSELIDIRDWFPIKSDSNIGLSLLSQQFITSCSAYFTSKEELITFTSGFDGRTILATAIAQEKKVYTFSMGRMENDDVYNPQENANDLSIPFEAIDLVSKKYLDSFFESAKQMSKISGGRNGFLYPHFYYCSKLFEDHKVMQTGYCGSELFRALHIAGAVTSKEFVSLFLEKDDGKLAEIIFESKRLKFINPELINRNRSCLWEKVKLIRSQGLHFRSTNHFFYYFIFKEVFRKVFGFWTTAQFENKKVRTPFLDIDFVKLLLKSEFAGCNNSFFTHNPLKRYKGQLLYAQILKTLNSPLFFLMTGKNYTPEKLLSFQGQLSIVLPYVKKKIRKKTKSPNRDNLGLITGYKQSIGIIIESLESVSDIYSLVKVHESLNAMNSLMSEEERDMLFQIASLSLTLRDDEIDGPDRL